MEDNNNNSLNENELINPSDEKEKNGTSTEITVADDNSAAEKTAASDVKASDNKPLSAGTTGKTGIIGWFTNPATRIKAILLTVGGVAIIVAIIIILCSLGKEDGTDVFTDDTVKTAENADSSVSAKTITDAPKVTEEVTPEPTPTPEPTATPTPEPTPMPTPIVHENEGQSALTGEWVSNEVINQRPYCIMFNNIEFANPQSGIGCADVLYEALTEGGITRMMGVFEDLQETDSCAGRIGSVRSARHYFAEIADMYDSIFIHYGETTYATKKIKALNLDHIEGTYGVGDYVYYRDKSIKAPHNAFASLAGIHKGIDYLKLRTEHEENWKQNHFEFVDPDLTTEEMADEETLNCIISNESYNGSGHRTSSIEGRETAQAVKITLDYSNYMKPYLTYDETTGLYSRYQYKGIHIDYNTNEPLAFKNVIIQIVKEWDKDKNGYQDMELMDASGDGYYITEGKMIPITWTRNEKERFMMYYTMDGEPLVLNNGKTFISVYPNFRTDRLIIE